MAHLVGFFVWSAAVYGVAMIVTTFKLFVQVRDFFPKAGDGEHVTWRNAPGTLLNCTPCFATYVAMGFAVVGYTPIPTMTSALQLRAWVPGVAAEVFVVFLAGMVGAALAWTWRVVLAWLGSQKL